MRAFLKTQKILSLGQICIKIANNQTLWNCCVLHFSIKEVYMRKMLLRGKIESTKTRYILFCQSWMYYVP
jgi:hypothetical protein